MKKGEFGFLAAALVVGARNTGRKLAAAAAFPYEYMHHVAGLGEGD